MPLPSIKHPQNQAVPNPVCHPAAGTNLSDFPPNGPADMRGETTTDDPERQARLVFNQPKRAHVTPLLIELHWLPVAARIKFKSLMLAYRVLEGSAPTYLNALVRANITPRMLRSSSERRLALLSVQTRQSRLFSFVVPRWWNELPSTTRAGGVPPYLQEAFEDPTLQRAPPFLTGTSTSA